VSEGPADTPALCAAGGRVAARVYLHQTDEVAGTVRRWMLDPARTVPLDLPARLAATVRTVDLTRPTLLAPPIYRVC
jgi:hypothetical protein